VERLMLFETLLTAYLKRKNTEMLCFDRLERIAPPVPEPGMRYLLYVHIPFCEELCPYCSFNRFPLEPNLAREYFKALEIELDLYRESGFDFVAAYVGGGTPTVLPDAIAGLLAKLKSDFGVKEISVETNPNHLTDEIVSMLKDSGVNRLSVGVQSFDDELLRTMERYNKYGGGEEIKAKLKACAGIFDTLNVDMIFNFPTQTLEKLTNDLDIIKELQSDQVTFYPLMVSDMTKTELAKRFGKISYAQEKLFYNKIADSLADDYTCGTAWCFSRKKTMIDEYIVDYDEYVGAGSGAFGYVNGACFANTFSIREYIESCGSKKLPLLAKKSFSEREQIQYDFMMKLFGTSLDIGKQEAKFNGRFLKTLWKELPIFRLIGALNNADGRLKLTRKGQYFWVIMMREFFTGVNNFRDICRAEIKG
jgi:menaquinone C8-methyltransferase